jgi:uncharacterized protein YbjT (DUF2867 family)
MNTTNQYLVIGASGKTGRRVLQKLQNTGLHARGASRHGEVHFDWHDDSTWAPAINGVDAIYVTYYPDLAIPRAPEDISKFCALAKAKGVKHLTLLSGRGEPAAQDCENIVKQSGLRWTIIRASWFNQNFSEGMFRDFIISGQIALPVDSTTEPFIDIDDIAEVAFASLTDPKHDGQLYEVTGPELCNFADLSEKFTEQLGREITFQQINLETFRANLLAANVDEGAIEALVYLFTEVLDGRNEYLCDGVQRALGRDPKPFDDFIKDNKQWFTQEA